MSSSDGDEEVVIGKSNEKIMIDQQKIEFAISYAAKIANQYKIQSYCYE